MNYFLTQNQNHIIILQDGRVYRKFYTGTNNGTLYRALKRALYHLLTITNNLPGVSSLIEQLIEQPGRPGSAIHNLLSYYDLY